MITTAIDIREADQSLAYANVNFVERDIFQCPKMFSSFCDTGKMENNINFNTLIIILCNL